MMPLDVAQYIVQEVEFGNRFAWGGGCLTIDPAQLRVLFCQEPHIQMSSFISSNRGVRPHY
jgi:hypothetical protein